MTELTRFERFASFVTTKNCHYNKPLSPTLNCYKIVVEVTLLKQIFMSDYLKRDIDYLDEETYIIINGYFRLSFPSNIMPLYIIHITTVFIDDHFMLTRGSYQWIIDNDTLQLMKSKKGRSKFSSHTFKIAELEWIIDVYPNICSSSEAGIFQVYLRLVSLPTTWEHVLLCLNIRCPETQSSHTSLQQWDEGRSDWGWPPNAMKFTEIESLNQLSFIASIRVNKIKLKNSNKYYYQQNVSIPRISKIEWKINEDLLSKMKLSHNGKRFTSPIYNDTFCFAICPNGESFAHGRTKIELVLCALPPNQKNINLKWKINLNATESSSIGDKTYYKSSKKFSFDKFQKLKGLTIHADITNNTVENEDAASKWDRFVTRRKWKGKTLRDNNDYYEHRLNLLDSKLKSITTLFQEMSQQMCIIIQSQNNDNRANQNTDGYD